jgi:transposase
MESLMFFRSKSDGARIYLQLVENQWINGRSRQRVVATIGRMDQLQESGQIEAIVRSAAKFSEKMIVLTAHEKGQSTTINTKRVGPGLIFERLWTESGCRDELKALVGERKFLFDVERVVFLTVLSRLVHPCSDRQWERWQEEYVVEGCEKISLHHYYRAMAWLGEEREEQTDALPFAPRCTKDLIEEGLFLRRRDLFSSLEVVFFDTTSLYFEGEGGESLGERGYSKDHRPDLKQMVLGVVLDNEGRPVCCEMWPGNTTDVRTLIPVVDRLKKRFGIHRVCIVADRGMISQGSIEELESEHRQWDYILGVRMRKAVEVKGEVLSRAGRYQVVYPAKEHSTSPSPLKVKEVKVEGRRYIVCHNEDQARKDEADREAIVAALEEQLTRGEKSLVGNKGYRKFLKRKGKEQGFEIDPEKVEQEARYDGKWVLRTNREDWGADEVALQYKQLLEVEQLFRCAKSVLETRPVYHKRDETIRGHVFCSFLALVLMKELHDRLEARGLNLEWADIIRDLDRLQEVEIEQDKKRFVLRTQTQGTCGKIFQAVGVALPPTLRQVKTENPAKEGTPGHC